MKVVVPSYEEKKKLETNKPTKKKLQKTGPTKLLSKMIQFKACRSCNVRIPTGPTQKRHMRKEKMCNERHIYKKNTRQIKHLKLIGLNQIGKNKKIKK